MLNFSELPRDGMAFEQMIREIMFSYQLHAKWSGFGADGGKDLIVKEELSGFFANQTRTWLVQCKHHAHSRKSVGHSDLDDIVDSCAQHGATGYLLACSTQPSSALVSRLEGISFNKRNLITAKYWDSVEIERRLSSPRRWYIAQQFMPKSAGKWKVYATESRHIFVVHYKGFVIDAVCRKGTDFEERLSVFEERFKLLEELNIVMPMGHVFMPRRTYHDEKRACYTWDIDYMYPEGEPPIYQEKDLVSVLGEVEVLSDGQCHYWEARLVEYQAYFADDDDLNHDRYYRNVQHRRLVR